jgi:glycosyltransferase involved in cell wall biosynthesis
MSRAEPRSILFVDHSAALGGAEHSLLLLIRHLDPNLWRPVLACGAGDLADAARRESIPTIDIALPRLRRSARAPADWYTGARTLSQIVRAGHCSALYTNTIRATWYGALAARLSGLPLVWHMRDFWLGETAPRQRWADRLGKRLLQRAAAEVIANSAAVAAILPSQKRVAVVPNGIELSDYVPGNGREAFRAGCGIPADAPVVGMVGRLRPWKGQVRFLRMASALDQEEAHYLVVGGEPFGLPDDYRRQLLALTDSLGLADRVHFTGQLADPRPALAAMDIYVHPGDPEPFGLVNIEAMAMALPVVAFAHGALPEIVREGVTGLLVPPLDERALAGTVLALLHTPQRAKALGAAGRARALECYGAATMAGRISALLEVTMGRIR